MKPNYEHHSSTAVPWDFLLKSIYPFESSHKKALQKILDDKKSIQATSIYLGISFNSLRRKLKQEEMEIKKVPTVAERLQVHSTELRYLDSQEIADLIGCTKKSVNFQCKKLNIKYIKRVNAKH